MTQDMPRLLLVIRGIMSIGFGLSLMFSMTELRFSKKRSILTIALFVIFTMCTNSALLQWLGYTELSKLLIILFTTWIPSVVLIIYLSRDRFFKCLYNIGMMLGIFCTIYWVSSFFISLFHAQLLADILIRAVLYGLTFFVCHRYIKKKYRLFVDTINQYWCPISITSILFALLIAMQLDLSTLYFDTKTYICLALTSSLMLLMYVIVFLTFQNTHDLMLKSQTEQSMKLQIALQKEQYNAVKNKMEADKAFRHDLRHHANLLTGMLQDGRAQDALTYVQKLGASTLDRGCKSYCENLVVNTILAYHLELARASGMTVECKAIVPEKIGIDEMELCTVLSNLLENATLHGLYAVYVDEKGKVSDIAGSVYDQQNKVLRFTINHFSIYGIGYKTPVSRGVSDFDNRDEAVLPMDKKKYLLHTVRKNEYFYVISKIYGCTQEEIMTLNGLRMGDVIHPGDVLKVPEK